MQFKIEQIALHPADPEAAIALLSAMGLNEWARDHVCAEGAVFGIGPRTNAANLAFNYEATRGLPVREDAAGFTGFETPKPLELEVLHYTAGDNWMLRRPCSVSHLGMHCTADELVEWRKMFADFGIETAQDVNTSSHTNPVIAGKRQYTYVIFDTREILGVDVKFIVRRDVVA